MPVPIRRAAPQARNASAASGAASTSAAREPVRHQAARGFLEMHQQDGNRRGRDARDARRLAHRGRANLLELLAHFVREPGDARVVEVVGQARFFVAALARDFFFLALDVAGVFRGHFELRADLRRKAIVVVRRPSRR